MHEAFSFFLWSVLGLISNPNKLEITGNLAYKYYVEHFHGDDHLKIIW